MGIRGLLVLIISLLFLPVIAAADAPNVTLVSPSDNNISVLNNVTFICNVTDDENVYRVSLYNDVNETFGLYNIKRIMELEKDSNTLLLCRFDGSYVCEDGEQGTNTSTDFVSSKFMQGVRVNDSDNLTYLSSNNMEYDQGTIEFWLNPGFDPSSPSGTMNLYTNRKYDSGIDIYVDISGTLYFGFNDDSEYTRTASKDISSWNQGEWHHVAFVWEYLIGSGEMSLDLFTDGSNTSVTHGGDFYSYVGSFGSNMYIGSDVTSGNQANSTFDEFRISDKVRSLSEINASYLKGGDHKSEKVNWTLTGIDDGVYIWNCLAYDNGSSSSWNGTNRTLYVDTSPPNATSVTFSPNSTGDLDPEITINFTANVTDLINVSSVILQWKETGEWINDTMDYSNSTELYENASLTFDQTGGVYYYRIWSNDTVGHSGSSSTYNVTAEWDYTWTRSPSDFGIAYGFVGCSNCDVGTLTINNTGDDTLSFFMTDDWPLSINYNVSNPFSLGPKNVSYINVTSEFSNEDSENDVTITITASHGSETPSPVSQTVTATLNSYSGGPYFDSDDVTVTNPISVYQGMSYNLSAKLKNIGNESATGVWINWSLPAGWTNTSGNLTLYVGDLNGTAEGGNMAWNNITVYLSPGSATAGVAKVYVNATSSENLTTNSSVSIYVICNDNDGVCGAGCSYVTDDDCSAPSGGGNGGGVATKVITGEAKEYEIVLDIPSRLDINRGEKKIIKIGVKNTVEDTKLNNVYLSLSGYPQTFVSFSPTHLTGIEHGETMYFYVEIKAPIYAAYKKYDLELSVKSEFLDGGETKEAEKTGKILLVTHKFVENETIEYFERAWEALKEMNSSGLDTRQISEMVEDIENAMEEGNYEKVKKLSEEVIGMKNLAFKLNGQIQEMEKNIENLKKQDLTLSETEKMLFLAKSAFQRGEYERSEERMRSALFMYAIEMGSLSLFIFIYNYWWLIGIAIAVSGTGILMGRRKLVIGSLRRTLDSLVGEEGKIKELVADVQRQYFERKMGFERYSEIMGGYENGMVEIRKRRGSILSKLTKMIKLEESMSILKGEEGRVKGLIAETQKKYFHLGKMGKGYYDKMMEGLKSELFEIQKQMEGLESGKNV